MPDFGLRSGLFGVGIQWIRVWNLVIPVPKHWIRFWNPVDSRVEVRDSGLKPVDLKSETTGFESEMGSAGLGMAGFE